VGRKQVSGYVDEDAKSSYKALAEAADMSLSEWVVEACEEKAERESFGDQATRFKVERRLLSLVDEAADRAADRIVDRVLSKLAEQIEGLDQSEGSTESDPYSDWGEDT